MSQRVGSRPIDDDDEYFEELTKAVFANRLMWPVVEAKWPSYRRAFSNFSIREVADYLPEDVDRLMSDPAIVGNLRKIEATIENAAEMLLIQIEQGSFGEYLDGFDSPEDLAEDVSRRFRQIDIESAREFVRRVTGPTAVAN